MNISTLGRCIDQPLIVNKFNQKMPALLIGAGTAYGIFDTIKSTKKQPKEIKHKKLINNSIIIASTIAASLAGARGLKIKNKQILPALLNFAPKKTILSNQNKAIDKFLQNNTVTEKISTILNKAKSKALNIKETHVILNDLPESKAKSELLKTILPVSENLSSKEIFNEIGRLSLLGAIPVIGGVAGGIAADKITKQYSPKCVSNKIKEGFYQYFANIFLCNVGACAALFSAERLQSAKLIKPLTPIKRLCVILAGITSTGIIGGSYIANKLSQKIIDPIFNKNKKIAHKSVYDERKPELTDIALHTDDIATAGVLSGFKWIEPALPLMYFVSGYRAGIGYRNNTPKSPDRI